LEHQDGLSGLKEISLKREHSIASIIAILGISFFSTTVVFAQAATSKGEHESHHAAAESQSMPSPSSAAQGMGTMSNQGMIAGEHPTTRAGDLAAGKASYTTFCAKCHGDSGKGDGSAGVSLQTKPRDFTNCAEMTPMPDDMLFKVIKDGGAASGMSREMPPWKDAFEDPEIKDLVAYVRTFCKK
jgi:mono/diheme cytochrome c family protein